MEHFLCTKAAIRYPNTQNYFYETSSYKSQEPRGLVSGALSKALDSIL